MSLAQKINRVRVAPFEVVSEFQPAGDQPKAIAELSGGSRAGEGFILTIRFDDLRQSIGKKQVSVYPKHSELLSYPC